MKDFLNWLLDQTVRAEEKAAETSAIAPNSYGAGYDRGYADALICVNNDGIQSLGGGDSALYPAPDRGLTGESQPVSDPGLPPPNPSNAASYGNSPREIQRRAMKAMSPPMRSDVGSPPTGERT